MYANAQENQLDSVVISADRTSQRVMDTAASVNVVTSAQIHDGQAQINLSEPLERMPGIFALSRQNFAQDLLISSRGFGANSTFGARGIKIFVDGIPGTVADGQGQISHIDLASADHIEVMRGPFSALYGNSAGGVIQVFTESGKPGIEITPYASTGAFGQSKYGVKVNANQNNIDYVLDAGAFQSDGSRDHSAVNRANANIRLGLKPAEDTSLTIVANHVNLDAQDPLGLTLTQWQNNPSSAVNVGSFNTRKSIDQTQLGLVLKKRIDSSDSMELTPYYGQRSTTQFLASAVNGAINLNRDFYGLDGKWLYAGSVNSLPLKLVAGVDSNANVDHRKTHTNSLGNAVVAATDQDYGMQAGNLDEYLQGELRPSEKLALTLGARYSETTLSAYSNNKLPSFGAHSYQATTGVTSAQYYVQENTNVYASYGVGFDTPTLNQVMYAQNYVLAPTAHPVVNQGNMGLLAASTQQVELGVKSELSATSQIIAAVFAADTVNEIVIGASNGGKTSYMNAPRTSRLGLEFSGHWQLPYQLQANIAYTLVNATVVDSYSGTALVNNNPVGYTVNSGNRIPGVPQQGVFLELMWRDPANSYEIAAEVKGANGIATNDVNSETTNGYGIMNLRAVARQTFGRWKLSEFARIDNIFDNTYVDSVIVNQASSQFYENAPGRNWMLGFSGSYQF